MAIIVASGESPLLLFSFQKPISFIASSLPADPELSSQLFSILSRPNWLKHPSLNKLLPSISPSHVCSLFTLNLDPQTALGFFNWIALKPGYKHDIQCHSSLLNILIPNGFFRVAENIRISMVKACASVEDASFVLELLWRINRDANLEFKLTLRCYYVWLMSLAKFLMTDCLKSVFGNLLLEMLESMVLPNVYALNTMVNAYCKLGNVAEAKLYCGLGSPTTIMDPRGAPFPLFGQWLNSTSHFQSCFSGRLAVGGSLNTVNGSLGATSEMPAVDGIALAASDLKFCTGSGHRAPALVLQSQTIGTGQRKNVRDKAWVPKPMLMDQCTLGVGNHVLGNPSSFPAVSIAQSTVAIPVIDNISNMRATEENASCMGVLSKEVVGKSKVDPIVLVLGRNEKLGPWVFSDNKVNFQCDEIGGSGLIYFSNNGVNCLNKSPPLHLENGLYVDGPPSGIHVGRDVGLLDRPNRSGPSVVGATRFNSSHLVRSAHQNEREALASFLKTQDIFIREIQELDGTGKNKRKSFGVDIGISPNSECNERTTPVKKRRLDVEPSPMGVTPLVSMRRVKRVVRDYPRGTGPLGRVENNLCEHASNESTEEPLQSDEIVSRGGAKIGGSPSFKGVEPVSVGQSVRLTAWKMKARLMDLSIPRLRNKRR
ncbi:hypothetical protein F8388_027352 [Cannabis sativa]|uniref:Pentatricopeptide repeat-containing protein n=1 Tax=Cannabis sativa TaxID=3483 RepID=A0A7J6E7K6_CANSA|nr:hypothetical protein F8388_027352 [Cannabis sativa]